MKKDRSNESQRFDDLLWPTDTKHAEGPCGTRLIEKPDFKKATGNFSADSVTLTTQCDTHRLLRVRDLASQWQGPISLALMVQQRDLGRVRVQLRDMGEVVDKFVSVHVMVAENRPADYPINAMRNLALKQATTEWVFVLDADENTERMQDHLDVMRRASDGLPNNQSRVAFVVRSFEWKTRPLAADAAPRTWNDLVALQQQDKVTTKHHHNPASYGIPTISFRQWANMTVPQLLPLKDAFEPYFIIRRNAHQLFNTRFVGYGGNKVTLTFKLQLSGWRFQLLPRVFTFAPEVTKRCVLPRGAANIQDPTLYVKTINKLVKAFPQCQSCETPRQCLSLCGHLQKNVVSDPVRCSDVTLAAEAGMVATQMNPFKRLFYHVTRCFPCDFSHANLMKFITYSQQ
eukprot:TRINITY_DN105700_c0_g1_i1.p1 TRINITY_DN105700_c0_g1~~TRINITY_DN105700_c0_g1_i1.p1  ORF type:complete len:461 (-),score=56.78 TRINITY_DN105700_c0_g1_i1:89-1291(-)